MIRQATENDLKSIADVHTICFPDSFSTRIGKNNLIRFYGEYMQDVPELFLVSEENGKITGFCMGYYCEKNDYMRSFVKNNKLRVAAKLASLLLKFDHLAWRKVKDVFKKEDSGTVTDASVINMSADRKGDLLSICVLPECRGNGTAKQLISSYEKVLREAGRDLCLLSVELQNGRGVHFYEKQGYMLYKKTNKMGNYAKNIKLSELVEA